MEVNKINTQAKCKFYLCGECMLFNLHCVGECAHKENR